MEATIRHIRSTKTEIGSGQIEKVAHDKAEGGAIVLTIAKDDGGKSEKRLNAGFLGAALIRYCLSEKIPIPRSATKRVIVDDEAVTIEFVMTLQARNIITPG